MKSAYKELISEFLTKYERLKEPNNQVTNKKPFFLFFLLTDQINSNTAPKEC